MGRERRPKPIIQTSNENVRVNSLLASTFSFTKLSRLRFPLTSLSFCRAGWRRRQQGTLPVSVPMPEISREQLMHNIILQPHVLPTLCLAPSRACQRRSPAWSVFC